MFAAGVGRIDSSSESVLTVGLDVGVWFEGASIDVIDTVSTADFDAFGV